MFLLFKKNLLNHNIIVETMLFAMINVFD